MDFDIAIAGAQFQQIVAIFHDSTKRHGVLVEFVASGLNARKIENFVDEVEKMHAGIMDLTGIFLVDRRAVRTENFTLHHL